MKPAPAPSPPESIEEDADPQRAVRLIVSRHFFVTAAVVALLTALIMAVLPLDMAPTARWPLILSLGALAVLAALSLRAGATRTEDLVAVALIGSIAAITLAVTLLDWGIAGPGLGFFGLLTCMVAAVAGLRLGLLVAALSAAVVLGLAYAQHRAWLPAGNAAVSADSLGLRTLIQLFVIGTGLAGGQLVSRVVLRYVEGSNPNGSLRNIAGIANEGFNVAGLMPHPDRASEAVLGSADGRWIFASMIRHLETTRAARAA